MKRIVSFLLLCSILAVTAYASDYKSGWDYINFYESVQNCRESIVYPQVKSYRKKGIEAKHDEVSLKNEMIAITPVMDKFATDTCFCTINEIAKDNTFEQFQKGIDYENYMQTPRCKKILENSINSLKQDAILAVAAKDVAASPCLKYEPEIVELKGEVKRVIFPGPPNYESVKDGDQPEPYYVLFLSKGICVQGDPKDEINSQTEIDIKSMQLMITDYKKYQSLLGKTVIVKGQLMHSHTGHHHTKVLVQVESMKKSPTRQ